MDKFQEGEKWFVTGCLTVCQARLSTDASSFTHTHLFSFCVNISTSYSKPRTSLRLSKLAVEPPAFSMSLRILCVCVVLCVSNTQLFKAKARVWRLHDLQHKHMMIYEFRSCHQQTATHLNSSACSLSSARLVLRRSASRAAYFWLSSASFSASAADALHVTRNVRTQRVQERANQHLGQHTSDPAIRFTSLHTHSFPLTHLLFSLPPALPALANSACSCVFCSPSQWIWLSRDSMRAFNSASLALAHRSTWPGNG